MIINNSYLLFLKTDIIYYPNRFMYIMKIFMIDTFQKCSVQVSHTYQNLARPITEAMASKKKVDMFVVIVDSVARFCRQGQVPMQEFIEYRKKFNDRAK